MSEESPVRAGDHWFIGEDRTFRHTVVDDDGDVQPITGWGLEWVLRERPDAGTTILTKTVGSGITITNGTAGICSVAIADADTIALNPGDYYYTLRRSDAGYETVLAFGRATLRQAATR